MSKLDIKRKIGKILSDIFSDKYDAKITINFIKEDINGNSNSSRDIEQK